jgi:hypothetical protein
MTIISPAYRRSPGSGIPLTRRGLILASAAFALGAGQQPRWAAAQRMDPFTFIKTMPRSSP